MSCRQTGSYHYCFDSLAFGLSVRAWIDKRPLRHVAEDTDIAAATLSRIQRGHTPDLLTFMNLCQFMNADPNEFVYTDWEREP
jgi:transcriptional regulator with XRE-family HTH domain